MERYRNLGGNSDVVEYEIKPGTITIRFEDGSVFLYTTEVTGARNVEEMQRRASVGRGLSTYINTVVKKNYAKKLRL